MISKMNYSRNKGYWCRFFHTKHSKYFSKIKFNGWKNANKAAKDYHKKYLAEHPIPACRFSNKPIITNTSGTNGVHRSFERNKKTGTLKHYWCASYTSCPKGQPKSKRFYVLKRGEAEAKREAIEFRQTWEKQQWLPDSQKTLFF